MIYYYEKSSRGIEQVNLKTKLFNQRVIFLDTEIDRETANDIIMQLAILDAESYEPITVCINSNGGEIQYGLSIIDSMKACRSPIHTVGLASVSSMGTWILAAGNNRYLAENCRVMIHEPLIAGNGVTGSCSRVEEVSKSLIERKKKMNQLLSEFTGKSLKTIEKETSYDHYMNAKEAVLLGLADEICIDNKLSELLGGKK